MKKVVHQSEDEIKAAIRKFYGLRDDMRLFTNPVGNLHTTYGGRVIFGLCVGSSDLIGWITIDGKAVFLALEVKDHKGEPTDDQLNFIDMVRQAGGIAGIVRSVQDAEDLLNAV